MPVPRTELREELTILIAAGRELSPDHDHALAEAFIDRVTARLTPAPRTRRGLIVWGKPRRLLGAAIVGLACLGAASVLSLNHTGTAAPVQAPQPAKVQAMPVAGKMPMAGKVPVVPPAPKAPPAPVAPEPKTAP